MDMKKVFGGLVATMLIAGTAQAATLDLNFQSLYNPAQRQNADALEPWAKSIEKVTNGEVKMHFFYTGGIVEGSDVHNGLKHGMVDAAGWAATDIKLTPYLYMVGIPYLSKDQAHAYRVIKKLYDEVPELRKDFEYPGKLLSFGASAPFMVASKDTPVHSPKDFVGKRVLVTSGMFGEIVEAWGGIPVTVSMGDVYVGLQRGMGEMFICGVSCVKGARVQEFCKYSVATGQTSVSAFPYNINKDVFEQDLTPEQQKAIVEASKDLGQKVVDSFLVDVENTYKEFREAGMEVYFPNEQEMAEFKKATMSIIEKNWLPRLADAGVKDPAKWVKKYYDIAATVE